MRKTRRGKAVDIPQKVKERVWERDGGRCVFCKGGPASPNAHFISRQNGGLGIEENIVTLCNHFSQNRCHHVYDNGTAEERAHIRGELENYLKSQYPGWCIDDIVYKK